MNSARVQECTELSKEILGNFELLELSVSNIILKCLRLCRLLGDEVGVLLFTYESTGYPLNEKGHITSDAWRISKIAGRRSFKEDAITKKPVEYTLPQLIAEIEDTIDAQKIRLSAAGDPSMSLSSANPHQFVSTPLGNAIERTTAVTSIRDNRKLLALVKGSLYNYILPIYNKLAYGNIVEDTFTNMRLVVNNKLSTLCPKAIEKFVAVYDNMDSANEEDWANAVHSCRRILLDLADALYPPSDEPLVINGKTRKVGKDQYINRLIQFISGKSVSKTYQDVVGSDLSNIGNRLDAVNDATCKGTHTDITKDEAARYIIHTYLLISDIIALMD